MNDNNPDLIIEIQIKNDDINVISSKTTNFKLEQKEKSLILIALYQLKQKIINNELEIEVKKC
ncbi:MAG: hypothetical protein IE890_02260 [Arcobacter sp.]|jgi:hypothetical protein|uniref:hypothetical protein n=1 Tax=Arcobacter sp. L TaxID=944547 RepID=UPI00022964DA|nr:hypothetical protein [Arcobacter sp. L]MBD3829289.1 hypothetical protein [Arcobacter sp.]BAK73183.1 hypothetical protein ABLL_1308 [Arcobacter sp. L]